MSQMNQASIVCRHVLSDYSSAQFVCNDSAGWSAGCSIECLENSGPAMLHMVCLSCYSDIPGLPDGFHLIPANFAYFKRDGSWLLDYCSPFFEPEEGEFIAAPEDHPARQISDGSQVNALVLPNGDFVTVRFDEGVRCLPFWTGGKLPEGLLQKCDGTEVFTAVSYGEVRKFARKQGIRFLAADFLSKEYDLAVMV